LLHPVRRYRLVSAGRFRLALPALIAVLGVAGFVVAKTAIDHEREDSASRRAAVESVHVQGLLARARAYVTGLATALGAEARPSRRRFEALVGTAAGTVGLDDVLWVRNRTVAFGTGGVGGAVRPGTDVSAWPALGPVLGDPRSRFALTATRIGAFVGQTGFFLVDDARFGQGAGSAGSLVVFIPRGWSTVSLQDDTRRVAVSLDGWRLDGGLTARPTATARFAALGRQWRVDAVADPKTALQEALPWVALFWPAAAALIALLVARGILRRRRAEREAERIFDLSLDLLCVAGDRYFYRVNPAFERTLGYSSEELLSRPFMELVHPDDRDATEAALERLAAGNEVVQFQNRYICADGTIRWLEWSVRPAPDDRLLYAAARDVTERRELVAEQAALRRVATRVAQGGSPAEVFAAVAAELAEALGADAVGLLRFDADDCATVVATHGVVLAGLEAGAKLPLDESDLLRMVRSTRGPARVDLTEAGITSPLAGGPLRTIMGTPIVIEGRLWGLATAAWRQRAEEVPADTEMRFAQFTELLATAVANAEGRAQLTASRARLVATGDETRRRIERDLHDGTQQRLVALALALRAAETQVGPEQHELRAELARTANGLSDVVEDLQEISRGLHPAILSKGGLGPALKALARRSAVPVELVVDAPERLPQPVEVAIYYVVSEALTNAAKHAHASVVDVRVDARDDAVSLAVDDDGVGGADLSGGSGLVGLRDRIEAVGGSLEVHSPPGEGTSLRAVIPPAH
jgi:PAS domain S-box-containing protein